MLNLLSQLPHHNITPLRVGIHSGKRFNGYGYKRFQRGHQVVHCTQTFQHTFEFLYSDPILQKRFGVRHTKRVIEIVGGIGLELSAGEVFVYTPFEIARMRRHFVLDVRLYDTVRLGLCVCVFEIGYCW